MKGKVLPFIAIPVKLLFPIMSFLCRDIQSVSLTEVEARLALADFTRNLPKTTENYIRSLRYLGLLERRDGYILPTLVGEALVDAGKNGWRRALTRHLSQISQLNDIGEVIIELGREGIPMTSNRWYFDLVSTRLMSAYGYERASIRRVDNYISLFRDIGFIAVTGKFPIPPKIESAEELYSLLKLAFSELKEQNPLFKKMPWLPISRLEDFFRENTNLASDVFWSHLLTLRRQRRVELIQTKPSIASETGLKTYEADGVLYGSVGLRGDW